MRVTNASISGLVSPLCPPFEVLGRKGTSANLQVQRNKIAPDNTGHTLDCAAVAMDKRQADRQTSTNGTKTVNVNCEL